MLLSIDIGSTNLKAGLFSPQGDLLGVTHTPTPLMKWKAATVIDPEALWQKCSDLIRRVLRETDGGGLSGIPAKWADRAASGPRSGQTDAAIPVPAAGQIDRAVAGPSATVPIAAVSITGMAESGLLIEASDGRPCSPIIPWFDASSQAQAEELAGRIDPAERFRLTGLHPSFKLGVIKCLWLQELEADCLRGRIWLSAVSYIAYRLTGRISEETTLAARTYAFRIDRMEWDRDFLRDLGLPTRLYPDVHPAGASVGTTLPSVAGLGLPSGAPVYVAGHDHLAAALAAGSLASDTAFNSMGTAEVLVGSFPRRELTREDYDSGLTFGIHHAPDTYFWMGGNSSSGGAVEWLRRIIGNDGFGYAELLQLLESAADTASAPNKPTGIVFFPYLSGRGAPQPDPAAKAGFLGLTSEHGKADLAKAVLEGNAYQMELIREAAERAAGTRLRRFAVVGGGTRNPHWLQIKANVSGLPLIVPNLEEAALAGAAWIAAVGTGCCGRSPAAASEWNGARGHRLIVPDSEIHAAYKALYERVYRAKFSEMQ